MSKTPVHLIAVAGSLRVASVNHEFARVAAKADIAGVTMNLHDAGRLPLYNGDDEAAGPPHEVRALIDAVGAADGLMLFSPEYNGSFPAMTKNVIDWLSRPPRLAWDGKPVTMVVATPGPRAGAGVRTHFDTTMTRQPVRAFESIGFGGYGERMTDGRLTDPDTITELTSFVERFAAFCREPPPAG